MQPGTAIPCNHCNANNITRARKHAAGDGNSLQPLQCQQCRRSRKCWRYIHQRVAVVWGRRFVGPQIYWDDGPERCTNKLRPSHRLKKESSSASSLSLLQNSDSRVTAFVFAVVCIRNLLYSALFFALGSGTRKNTPFFCVAIVSGTCLLEIHSESIIARRNISGRSGACPIRLHWWTLRYRDASIP